MHAWMARVSLAAIVFAAALPTDASAGGVMRDIAMPPYPYPVEFARPLLLAGGLPSVVYSTNIIPGTSFLHVTACDDHACSTATSELIDSSFVYRNAPAFLTRPDGRLLIVASGFAALGYSVYDCGDGACVFRLVTPIPGAAFSSLSGGTILSTGNIAVLFEGAPDGPNSGDMMILACGAAPASCATGSASVLSDVDPGTDEVFLDAEIAPGPGGTFAIAMLRSPTGAAADAVYQIVSCSSATCPKPEPRTVSGPTASSYPQTVAIVVRADGRPLALDAQPGRRVLIDCLDAACTENLAHPLPDNVAGTPIGLAVDAQGHARFGVWAPGEAGFFLCTDPVCGDGQRVVTSTPTTSFGVGKLAADANGSLAMAYVDGGDRTLRLVTLDRSTMPLFADSFEAP